MAWKWVKNGNLKSKCGRKMEIADLTKLFVALAL